MADCSDAPMVRIYKPTLDLDIIILHFTYLSRSRNKKWQVIRNRSNSRKLIKANGFVAVLRLKKKRYFNLQFDFILKKYLFKSLIE